MATLVQRLGLASTGNRATWTFSAWIKRSRSLSSANEHIFSSNTDRTGGGQYSSIYFGNDCLSYYDYYSSAVQKHLYTNRKFRDVNAWYHIVVRHDTTQATASDRIRFYVNGVQETSFSSSSYPSQNDNSSFVNWSGADNFLGDQDENQNDPFLGSISHVHLADGQSYAPTVFGETDANGVWKIKTSPSVTYGNNGFFILKDGNSVTDQSGNSNNFTVGGGTLTNTEDSPSNVFATMNPLTSYYAGAWTFSNGNNTVNMGTTSERYVVGTMGFSSGKWYWENKYISQSGETFSRVGIESNINDTAPDKSTSGYGYRGQPAQKVNNNTYTAWGSTYTTGDIIGVAVDMDNNYIYFSKNGVWQESGDPTSGATGTGSAFTIIDPPSGFYFPKIGKEDADTGVWSFNFGNGYFGTTAVSSAGTNASGIGIFEYDVPTGYTALSTKGLNL